MSKTSCDLSEQILVALRRVIRAIDQHSRKLVQSHGLTGPQALIIRELVRAGQLTGSELAKRLSLSQATVTDVVKRLESRGLVQRLRASDDRRKVTIQPTDEGRKTLEGSVPLLQERFLERLANLQDWEQTQLLASLQRIAEMMNAEDLDASPMLASGSILASPEAVQEATAPATTPDPTPARKTTKRR